MQRRKRVKRNQVTDPQFDVNGSQRFHSRCVQKKKRKDNPLKTPVWRKWTLVRKHTVQMHHLTYSMVGWIWQLLWDWQNITVSLIFCHAGKLCWPKLKVFSVWGLIRLIFSPILHKQRQYPPGNMRGLYVIQFQWGENGLVLDCRCLVGCGSTADNYLQRNESTRKVKTYVSIIYCIQLHIARVENKHLPNRSMPLLSFSHCYV